MREAKIGESKVVVLPSGAYHVRLLIGYDKNGRRKYKSITDFDLSNLQKRAYEWLANKPKEMQDSGQRPMDEMTLDEALRKYIDTCRMGEYSPATIVAYEKMRRNSYPSIIRLKLKDLNYDNIQEQIKDRAKIVKPKTVHDDWGLLHKVIRSYRPSLDVSAIVLPSKKKRSIVSLATDRCEIPTEHDVIRLLAAAKNNRELFLSILLCSDLGLRRSEVAALEWTDIDFDRKTVMINKALVKDENRAFVLKGTKSEESERELPMSDDLAKILYSYRRESGRVIGISPNAITRRWEKLKARLKISGRFHDLRHYHCSVMVALNVPKEYIMKDMGHSTDGLYQKVYTHIMPEVTKEIYNAMSKHSSETIGQFVTDERR